MRACGGDVGRRGVADDSPICGVIEIKDEAGLQVGLVEAGEGHAGVHGDEEGVEIFAAIVAVFVAGDGLAGWGGVAGEGEPDSIAARLRGQMQMAVIEDGGDGLAVERGRAQRAVAVVEQEIAGGTTGESQGLGPVDVRGVRAQRECEFIAQIGKARGASLRKRTGDAGVGSECGRREGGGKQSSGGQEQAGLANG